jgi:cytoskeletal protein RodZ
MSGSQADGPDSSRGAAAQSRPRRLQPWMLAVIGLVLLAVIGVIVWAAVAAAGANGSTSATPTDTSSPTSAPVSSSSPDAATTTDPASADPAAGDDVRPTSDPHPFDAPAEITSGVSATVGSLTAVTGVASGVGETGGPAVRFEVTITNNSAETIDLQNVRAVVDYGSDLTPASELSGGPDIVAFPASLEAGASATAAYVFTVPVEGRSDMRVTVDYLASVPFALFVGAAPTS